MPGQGLDILSTTTVNGVMQGLVDVRTVPRPLVFLNRTAVRPARDNEVMALYRGYTLIADIIMTGQRAAVYEANRIALEGAQIPNLKHGRKLEEQDLRDIYNLTQSMNPADLGMFRNWLAAQLDDLLLGIRQRMEVLCIAMRIDSLNYDRLGVKIVNATWGMPADLKFTASPGWSDASNAKPINDMLYARQLAQVRYGEVYNRVTLSLSAFTLAIQTTQFADMARFVLAPGMAPANIPLQDTAYLQNLLGTLLGMEVVLYDSRFWQQAADGSLTQAPGLPLNIVELSDSGDDQNPAVMDFANAVTSESLVSSMLPAASEGMIGTFTQPLYGPIAYGTAGHNPPEVDLWGVARGWPRKKRKSATATINVGTVTDLFPTTEPTFP
jgi:hypothetical protein